MVITTQQPPQLHLNLIQEIKRCVNHVIHFNTYPEALHVGVIKMYNPVTGNKITMIFRHVLSNYIIRSYIKTVGIYNYIN